MITADKMKKLAFEKKEELSEDNINIEKINNVILDKAEEGETCVEFDVDTIDDVEHHIAEQLYKAIKEKKYIYQSFIERGFKIEIKPKCSFYSKEYSSYSICISWD